MTPNPRARRLLPLVKEGFAASLTEAATRFAISHPAMGTILVGMATPQQFEDALAAVKRSVAIRRTRSIVGAETRIRRRATVGGWSSVNIGLSRTKGRSMFLADNSMQKAPSAGDTLGAGSGTGIGGGDARRH